MKKLIFLSLLLFASVSYSQSYTYSSDGDTVTVVDIWNLLKGTSHTTMSNICQYYFVDILVNHASDSCKVGFTQNYTGYVYVKSTLFPIGEFAAWSQPNIWFLAPANVTFTVGFKKFSGLKP